MDFNAEQHCWKITSPYIYKPESRITLRLRPRCRKAEASNPYVEAYTLKIVYARLCSVRISNKQNNSGI